MTYGGTGCIPSPCSWRSLVEPVSVDEPGLGPDATCLLQGCSVTQNPLCILVLDLHLDSWEYGLKWTDAP